MRRNLALLCGRGRIRRLDSGFQIRLCARELLHSVFLGQTRTILEPYAHSLKENNGR